MGRPPCCDKTGVKKGPWTPEEDIMLVSYVQEHGPGNWRAISTTTGLRRCSKSCRLRWTNYLRPGIKRGNFTDQEEKMVIQLQALLGNKWAAIASYLPERTDNDIKNYWNTHLKKKLKKLEASSNEEHHQHYTSHDVCLSSSVHHSSSSSSRGQWERTLQADITTAKQALHDALSLENNSTITTTPLELMAAAPPSAAAKQEGQVSTYALSTENITRLLKGWVNNNKSSNKTQSFAGSNEEFGSHVGFGSFESSTSDQFSQTASPEISKRPEKDGHVSLCVMLEDWLLNENSSIQGKEYLTNFDFDETSDIF